MGGHTGPIASFSVEAACRTAGLWPVAGVDEAGRGPLAGPVVAAAVVLDPAALPDGLADSKVLTPDRREALYAAVMSSALAVSVAASSAARIDRTNIRLATLDAMSRAVGGLWIAPRHVLVDGRDIPSLPLGVTGEAIVDGDAICLSIAAASIVAKVTRDRMMVAAGRVLPGYGFEAHKGYGASAHLDALARSGPTRLHRMTFGRLKGMARGS